MIPRRVSYLLFILLLLVSGGSARVAAQDGGKEYFSNGHSVSGEFLSFYQSVKEADRDRLFGLPISIVFNDPLQPGRQIQYFQRVRMDYDPAKPAGERVSLANLGEFYSDTQKGQPVLLPASNAMCRAFPNGKSVCYAFLQFYDEYGEKYLGQPISNALFTDEGLLVQYFQNMRLEWRGDLPVGQRVVVTQLGWIDYDKRIGSPSYLQPDPSDIPTVKEIQPSLYAFTARPLISNGGKQEIFALLHDQYGQPIVGASITINVTFPDGEPANLRLSAPPTNELGYTSSVFDVTNVQPNQTVEVTVEAEVPNGPKASAGTWFRVWW